MNEIKTFKNTQFGQLRMIERDGEPWFVGKDVADILGYKDTKSALQDHIDEEDKQILKSGDLPPLENRIPKDVIQRSEITTFEIPNRGMTIINESGLYSLILSSKLPAAKQFKRWVTSEVLPSIHKHGAYINPPTIDELIANPDMIIELAMQMKEERAQRVKLEANVTRLTVEKQIMAPKADYFDELVDRNLLTNFRETAKQLGVKEKRFISWLLEQKYLYRDKRGKLMPYEKKNAGLFEIKECTNEKTAWAGTQTL